MWGVKFLNMQFHLWDSGKEKNDFRAFFAKGEDCGESSCSCKDKAENS